MENKDLHPTIQLLLKRMETHPTEFTSIGSSWEWELQKIKEGASPDTLKLIGDALYVAKLDNMHQRIVAKCMNDGKDPPPPKVSQPSPAKFDAGVVSYNNYEKDCRVVEIPTAVLEDYAAVVVSRHGAVIANPGFVVTTP